MDCYLVDILYLSEAYVLNIEIKSNVVLKKQNSWKDKSILKPTLGIHEKQISMLLGRSSPPGLECKTVLLHLPIAKILSVKNSRAWVSMVFTKN